MFVQRHRVSARWAKSRQTPTVSLNASQAVRVLRAWSIAERDMLCTKSQIACTRAQPSTWPNFDQANSDSRSVSQ